MRFLSRSVQMATSLDLHSFYSNGNESQSLVAEFATSALSKTAESAVVYLGILAYVSYLAAEMNGFGAAAVILTLSLLSSGIRVSLPMRFRMVDLGDSDTRARVRSELIAASVAGAFAWAVAIATVYPMLQPGDQALFLILLVSSSIVMTGFMGMASVLLALHLVVVTLTYLVASLLQPQAYPLQIGVVLCIFALFFIRATFLRNTAWLGLIERCGNASDGQAAMLAQVVETKTKAETTLRASSEARNQYIARISHEFRRPLQSIVASVDLLRAILGRSNDARLAPTLKILDSASSQLLASSNDLAEYLRSNSMHVTIKSEPVELIGYLRDCIAPFEAQATRKGLALSFVHTESTLAYTTDSFRLGQIVNNLLSNAIKYTDTGRVIVSCQRSEDASVLISVQDTGSGISEDRKTHIWEPWFRVDESKQQGLGLGLAIVKATADSLGAKVELTSTLGVGTTMTIVLPSRRK